MGDLFISIDELKRRIGAADAPIVIDVRRRDAFDKADDLLPAARWREHSKAEQWSAEIAPCAQVVVYCVHGHQVSQSAAAALRTHGVAAQALASGIDGWREAGGMTIAKQGLPGRDWSSPSRWVTRVRPKIDRIACPWLIRRFIDREARFFFVAPDQVQAAADELAAVAFDVEGAEFSHEGELCSFDIFLDRFGIGGESLRHIAAIIRGADTARPELAPEASGLLALSLGLSALTDGDDAAMLEKGMLLYDALYAWRRLAAAETHNWPVAGKAA